MCRIRLSGVGCRASAHIGLVFAVSPRFARLSAADLINLAVEAPDTPMHVGVLTVADGGPLCDADGRLRLDALRSQVDRLLDGVPELRRIVYRPGPLAGRPLWVDDPRFCIDRHVNQVELPPPGDEPALLRLTEDLMAPLLGRDHPMWRMWFVTGLPDGRIAALIALHHAIADGLAAIQLLITLLDPSAATVSLPCAETAPPRWRQLAQDNVRVRLARLRGLVLVGRPYGPLASLRGGWRVLSRAWRAPRTSLTGPVGRRRELAVMRLDLAAVRRVAHAYDVKVNDVVLDLAAGGLRTLLRSRGEPVGELRLHAAVASSPHIDGPSPRSGNRSGVIVVKLPLCEPDSTARLRLISADSARAKRDQLPTAEQGMLVWLARLGLLRRYTRRQRLTNIVESNVIGPPTPIRLLGAPLIDLIPIGALAGNLAISFLACSYAGGLTIAVRVDADRCPDLSTLIAAMAQEWDTLLAQSQLG
jgi:WS/DGAT/MGAT family acyltransferase